jgi:hypothetical protein
MQRTIHMKHQHLHCGILVFLTVNYGIWRQKAHAHVYSHGPLHLTPFYYLDFSCYNNLKLHIRSKHTIIRYETQKPLVQLHMFFIGTQPMQFHYNNSSKEGDHSWISNGEKERKLKCQCEQS